MPPIKFKQLEGAYLAVKTFFLSNVAEKYSDALTQEPREERPNFETIQDFYLKGLDYIELMETELNDNLQYSNSVKKGFLVTRLTEIRSTPLIRQYTREWWDAALKTEPIKIDFSVMDIYFMHADNLISQFREKTGFYLQHLAQSINIDEIVSASKRVLKKEALENSPDDELPLEARLKTALSAPQIILLFKLFHNKRMIIPKNAKEIHEVISENFRTVNSYSLSVDNIKTDWSKVENDVAANKYWMEKFEELRDICSRKYRKLKSSK